MTSLAAQFWTFCKRAICLTGSPSRMNCSSPVARLSWRKLNWRLTTRQDREDDAIFRSSSNVDAQMLLMAAAETSYDQDEPLDTSPTVSKEFCFPSVFEHAAKASCGEMLKLQRDLGLITVHRGEQVIHARFSASLRRVKQRETSTLHTSVSPRRVARGKTHP